MIGTHPAICRARPPRKERSPSFWLQRMVMGASAHCPHNRRRSAGFQPARCPREPLLRQKPFGNRRSGGSTWMRPMLIVFFLVLGMDSAWGHVGSPNVFFHGRAGEYPVQVVIRPPEVIPGLAEISVRVLTNGVNRVGATPMRWDTGRQGAPRPDEARRVRGETNLYNTQLWFMRGGAQSVEVIVDGAAGEGRVFVPMNAVATRVLTMPKGLGTLLAALGVLLVALIVSIAGCAVRESTLPSGAVPSGKRRWLALAAMAGLGISVAGLLWFGRRWWEAEAADYRNNRLYRPLTMTASVTAGGDGETLTVNLSDPRFQRMPPLVPDHGKLMHLFLVAERDMAGFAHLHPLKQDWKTFTCPVPPLPAGRYSVYADVTYETGLSDTLTATIELAGRPNAPADPSNLALDEDDAWSVTGSHDPTADSTSPASFPLAGGRTVHWLTSGPLVENVEERLRFVMRDAEGRPLAPEPYLGMLGHLILRRDDGAVFTHLHPSGSYSMAAQQLFEMRAEGKAPLKVASSSRDPLCRLPGVEESQALWLALNPLDAEGAISFPYAFPKPGRYRLWLQARIKGEVVTAVFDAEARAAGG